MNNAIVIIPTYQERENIRDIIDAVFALPKDFHILVVDDNSPDGTGKIVENLQQHFNTTETKLHLLTRPKKLGLGTAYIDGFHFALDRNYEFILGYQKGGGILLANDSLDITQQILEGLNKKYEAESGVKVK